MYMKAAVIYEAGGPQQLKIRQVPVPSVKEGWSLIKIKGFGLNHSEICLLYTSPSPRDA